MTVAIAALLAAVSLAACGGGGEETTTSSTTHSPRGGDNSIQEFGSEAAGSDLDAAASALHGYLDARAAGAWRAACSYMADDVVESLRQLGAGSGGQEKQGCAELLAALSAAVPAAALRESAVADVGALRVEGDRAFLLFSGAHEADYFIPMAREAGEWKVAAIAPSALL